MPFRGLIFEKIKKQSPEEQIKGYNAFRKDVGNFEYGFICCDTNGRHTYIQAAYTLHGPDDESTDRIHERKISKTEIDIR